MSSNTGSDENGPSDLSTDSIIESLEESDPKVLATKKEMRAVKLEESSLLDEALALRAEFMARALLEEAEELKENIDGKKIEARQVRIEAIELRAMQVSLERITNNNVVGACDFTSTRVERCEPTLGSTLHRDAHEVLGPGPRGLSAGYVGEYPKSMAVVPVSTYRSAFLELDLEAIAQLHVSCVLRYFPPGPEGQRMIENHFRGLVGDGKISLFREETPGGETPGSTDRYMSPLPLLLSAELYDRPFNEILACRWSRKPLRDFIEAVSKDADEEGWPRVVMPWEAYLELHGRDIADWRRNGPNKDFPAGGLQATQILENEKQLRDLYYRKRMVEVEGVLVAEDFLLFPGQMHIIESVLKGRAARGSGVDRPSPSHNACILNNDWDTGE